MKHFRANKEYHCFSSQSLNNIWSTDMTKIFKYIILSVSLILTSSPGFASAIFYCQMSKIFCSKGGCKENNTPNEYRIINVDTGNYSLCTNGDEKCDNAKLKNIGESGIFAIFYFGGSSYLKLALEDEPLILKINAGDFVETRDIGLGVMNSYGSCKK